jgi:hypothetical protein
MRDGVEKEAIGYAVADYLLTDSSDDERQMS